MTSIHSFHTLIDSIDKATKADLQNALKTCEHEYRNSYTQEPSKKPVWRDMATLLRKQIRRF